MRHSPVIPPLGSVRKPSTDGRIPESHILREIMLALSALRRPDGSAVCVVWRQTVGTFLGPSGCPVRVGIEGQADIGGVLYTGRLSEAQERWGAMVVRMGGLWLVARSADEAVAAVRAAVGPA